MGESVYEKIGQLLDYEKLSTIHLLKLPKIEKKDIPNFINCTKYEKAKNALNQKMERYQSKVDRCDEAIRESSNNIAAMKKQRDKLDPGSGFFVDKSNAQDVTTYNDRLSQTRKMTDKINNAINKHNDLIEKRTEAKEEADEKLQELTAEALLVIDEDIVEVLDRCTEIVGKLADSQNTEDLVAAINICMIEFQIYAMFEELIEKNAVRKDCRERIAEVNQNFAALCANKNVLSCLVDMYQRNLGLVQKNDKICQQIVQVVGSVDQGKLANLTQSINAILAEEINTTFEYKGIVDPAQLDEIIVQIKETIDSLNQSIVKANKAVTAAGDFAKTGVSTDQQAEKLLSSMKSNVEAMKKDIFSQNHFAVQMIDEAVIKDFYHKDIRSAVTALRKHIVGAIGDKKLDNLEKGDEDRFSLEKAENAIKQANLVQLQAALDKIPAHIKKTTDLIASAESDIQEAGKVPEQNADALNAELDKKYILACFPVFGWISAIGILGRVKTFEPAFRSTNQIYQDLANALLVKNRKMTIIVMIIGAILGFGGMAVFFGLNLGNSVAVNVGVPGSVLVLYVITILLLTVVGKRLRSFCGNVSS